MSGKLKKPDLLSTMNSIQLILAGTNPPMSCAVRDQQLSMQVILSRDKLRSHIKMMEKLKQHVRYFSSKQETPTKLTGENPTHSAPAHTACSCAPSEEVHADQTLKLTFTHQKTMELSTLLGSKKEKAALMTLNRCVERHLSRFKTLPELRLFTMSGSKIQFPASYQHQML
jgi:hypothetical protein